MHLISKKCILKKIFHFNREIKRKSTKIYFFVSFSLIKKSKKDFNNKVKFIGCDPKGHELYLVLVKPFEKKVEATIGADVQIARDSWVKRRKTNRVT